MLTAYTLLKYYIITSLVWFIFMFRIIIERLWNNENINDVFGVSLLDITLFGFLFATILFVFMFLGSNKIYFHNNKFLLV
mgnify:CR=1 FL=1